MLKTDNIANVVNVAQQYVQKTYTSICLNNQT